MGMQEESVVNLPTKHKIQKISPNKSKAAENVFINSIFHFSSRGPSLQLVRDSPPLPAWLQQCYVLASKGAGGLRQK